MNTLPTACIDDASKKEDLAKQCTLLKDSLKQLESIADTLNVAPSYGKIEKVLLWLHEHFKP